MKKEEKAKMKVHFSATFLLLQLVLAMVITSASFVHTTMAAGDECGNKCGVRCSKAGMQDRCLKFCGICCRDCNCVPSGTYGNKHECPCYRDKQNSKGKPKCP